MLLSGAEDQALGQCGGDGFFLIDGGEVEVDAVDLADGIAEFLGGGEVGDDEVRELRAGDASEFGDADDVRIDAAASDGERDGVAGFCTPRRSASSSTRTTVPGWVRNCRNAASSRVDFMLVKERSEALGEDVYSDQATDDGGGVCAGAADEDAAVDHRGHGDVQTLGAARDRLRRSAGPCRRRWSGWQLGQ